MLLFPQYCRDMKAGRLFICTLLLSLFSVFTLQAQTANITEGCLPLEVEFMAPTGSSSFFWDFGDNATSNQQNPEHIFASAGTFDVEFSETNGGPVLGTVTITIYNAPEVNIASDPSGGCAPLLVQFGDSSIVDVGIPITGFQWVFGDGTAPETVQHPSHTFASVGVYTVSLNLQSPLPNCSATDIFIDLITVTDQPDVSFTTNPDPATACTAPLAVSFTNTSPNPGDLTFEWDFGNGSPISTETNPSLPQNYATDGIFTVSLTGTNSEGCSRTVTQIISIGTPLASFDVADTLCVGALTPLVNNSSNGSYLWTFGPGIFPTTSTQPNPTIRVDQPGATTIALTVTSPDGLCSSDTIVTIFAEEADASFTAMPQYSCTEPFDVTFTPNSTTATTYNWDFGDDSTSMVQSPIHTYFNADTTIHSKNGRIQFNPTLTVTTQAGCTATFTDTVVLFQPNALFMPDTTRGCAPLTVEFSDSSSSNETIVSWEWIYGTAGSETVSNGDPRTFTFNNPGEYDVVLIITNSAGCRDTSYAITILVGESITPDFTVDQTTVCPGDTVNFTDITNNPNIDEWHFDTDNRRSFHCFQEDALAWAYATETGAMDVTLTVGYNGCYTSLTRDDLVQVNGPIAHIDYEIDCANPFDAVFRNVSEDAEGGTWDFGDMTPNSTAGSITHIYADTGVYKVFLTAVNTTSGCPNSVDSVEINIRDLQADFFVGEMDTLLCQGEEYDLNATPSVDVHADCWRGYTWFFDDTRPITTQDSIIPRQFNQPGRQTVRLVARDINGCLDTAEQIVQVFTVTPQFTLDKDLICLPSTVNFTDLSVADTTISSIEWNFGDPAGTTSSDSLTSFTYTEGGPFTVTLLVTDVVGCGGTATQTIDIYQPTSSIQVSDNPICEGETINFAASDFTQQGSFLTFEWDFGNTETGMAQLDTITYTTPGNYTVTLFVEEDATGCRDTITREIEVQEFPMAEFISNLDGEPFICHPEQLLLTSTTLSPHDLNYSWTVDGQPGGNGESFSASLGKGTFDIELIVSTVGAACMDTVSRSYTLVGPEGDFDLSPIIICQGEEVTVTLRDTVDVTSFSWDFGDGTVIDDINPATHVYNNINPPSTIVTLVLRGENDACEFPVVKELQVRDITANFTTSTTCLDGVDFTNNSTGADSFVWDFGDGMTSMDRDPTHVYGTTGTFTVTLAVLNTQFDCRDTIMQTVTIENNPTPTASGTNACAGGIAELTTDNPISGNFYLWTPLDAIGVDNPNAANTSTNTLSGSGEISFILTEINASGCQGSDTVMVLITAPANTTEFDTTICVNTFTPFTLPLNFDTESYNVAFSVEDSTGIRIEDFGLSCTNCENPTLGNAQAGILIATITPNANTGCSPATATFNINALDPQVNVPNAFTPDGDSRNDFFNIVVPDNRIDLVNITRFQIFNRWGRVVYDNDEPMRGWDGLFKGKPAPSEVYVYVIEMQANGLEGCPIEKQVGDVLLIR